MNDGATTVSHAAAAEEVGRLFGWLFELAEQMRALLVPMFEAGPVTAAAVVAAIGPTAQKLLDRQVVLGGGFVAARGALVDHPLYLAWWQGDGRDLLGVAGAPGGDALDYTTREWFRVPESTGQRHIAGPYVDYVCTDEYVVTSTLPVIAHGELVGVVGGDILVESMERELLPMLRDAGATLVGSTGRVMVSADHRLAPGQRLQETASTPVPGFPLSLI